MKTNLRHSVSLLMFGLVTGLLIADRGTQVVGQGTPSSANNLANHHKELSFTLAPEASMTFPLPKADCPVRIEVAITNIVFRGSDGSVFFGDPLVVETLATLDSIGQVVTGEGATGQSGPLNARVDLDETGNVTIRSFVDPDSSLTVISQLDYCVHMWY